MARKPRPVPRQDEYYDDIFVDASATVGSVYHLTDKPGDEGPKNPIGFVWFREKKPKKRRRNGSNT